MKKAAVFVFLFFCSLLVKPAAAQDTLQWIRINQLGYTPGGIKVAVWVSKETAAAVPRQFELVNKLTGKTVFTGNSGTAMGAYGPFSSGSRLNFTACTKAGRYYIKAGKAVSPEFTIGPNVYDGAAGFCLQYMRQQRSGFNPFLKDSCHTHDGFTVYAPMPDGTHIDASGGWHDASDYLQYVTTSANATYHLLAAGRDFPEVFADQKLANGLDGSNGVNDVLDEARWGLDWLLKMHPSDSWMFNQLGDDRDHRGGMRIPREDTNFYAHGLERPVYFCTGEPQGLFKYKNRATGVASTAGKFASAFALGAALWQQRDTAYAGLLHHKALSAFALGRTGPGACQTAPCVSPYFYEEDNWTDDMELASAALQSLHAGVENKENYISLALDYAGSEPVTPWLGKDTARHYQWYPFINVGHYELAKQLKGKQRKAILEWYRQGIDRVWQKASQNVFYRGIPFIWCSNNLTTAFAIQCYWYRQLSGDNKYQELEQACFDWLFGCNPWGTGMVYGLPAWGDTPVDPHSAFSHLKHYPINGGLVDGPVYTSIYKNLLGIHLSRPDAYALFQSDLAVYHDDNGDYSTNEPTMDGTAVLIYLLAAKETESHAGQALLSHGGIIRGNTEKKNIALVFTADEFGDGLPSIQRSLLKENVKASFFFTGRFYRNTAFQEGIGKLYRDGHYLGPHSNAHLLYCDWNKRDSLLVTQQQFSNDLDANMQAIHALGIKDYAQHYFIPPYEWYNDTIAAWAAAKNIQLFNFTPGTGSNADYTYPGMKSYKPSDELMIRLKQAEQQMPHHLNGVILLLHAGTDPRRTDKFYDHLPALISYLRQQGYSFKRIDQLL